MKSSVEFKENLNTISGISIETNFYRFLKIEYLKNPLSGLGSFKYGGRYNFKTEFEVLYLTSDPDTAVAEGSRDRLLIPPSALITIKVRLYKIINFEDKKIIDSLGIREPDLHCPWRKIQDIDEKKAYTQVLGGLIHDSGEFEAIRYPSVERIGKYNLAVFTDRLNDNSEIKVYDPDNMICRTIKGSDLKIEKLNKIYSDKPTVEEKKLQRSMKDYHKRMIKDKW